MTYGHTDRQTTLVVKSLSRLKNQNIVLVHIFVKELVEHKNRIKLQEFITPLSSIFLSKCS